MIKLSTGSFEVFYDKGSVRWIKCSGIEIIRMIYPAVRDENWGTIVAEIISEKITGKDQGFVIRFTASYRQNDIDFEADYRIEGTGNRLLFEMEGRAKSTFFSNRTGFCVLHPVKECAGKKAMVFHPDGSAGTAGFPELIAPHQPMKNIRRMEWQPAENIKARLTFSGDVFEMEDQRNWTDASYKTYCRPLSLPFPYQIKEGDVIRQTVELEIQHRLLNCENQQEEITFCIDAGKTYPLPKIGLGNTSRREALTEKEAAVLRNFSFDHLRCELKFFEKYWKTEWERAVEEARKLDIPLFTVLYFSEHCSKEVAALQEIASDNNIGVKYILVVGRNHLPDDKLFNAVYDELKNRFPYAEIGAGVNAYFAELNRNRPLTGKAGFISFGVCPQVHAFDKASLVENMEGQKYAVESARNLFPGKPVFVSPVTMKHRFNVVAASEEPGPHPGELPSQVDERQATVFAAQWLLGSLKFLAQAGTTLVTFFETVGWRGFIQGDFDPPVPDRFPARKGDIFPAFHLIKELKNFGEVIHSESSASLQVDGLVLRNERTREGKIILVNFDSILHHVKVPGIKSAGYFRITGHESGFHVEGDTVSIPSEGIVILPFNG